MATWAQLKATGVIRCSAVFKGGKRCRRRTADQRPTGFCKRCGDQVDTAIKQRNDADK